MIQRPASPSGADQSDAEHQATDLAVGGGESCRPQQVHGDGPHTAAVTAERRVVAQARLSWQTHELVPEANTPAPLRAV
jgi:hypothetical protein